MLPNQLFFSLFAECVAIPRRPVGEDARPNLHSKISAKREFEQQRHRDNQVGDKGNAADKGSTASPRSVSLRSRKAFTQALKTVEQTVPPSPSVPSGKTISFSEFPSNPVAAIGT